MKKILSIVCLIGVFCLVLCGCTGIGAKKKTDSEKEFWFYYINSDESKLERKEYYPEETTIEYLLKDITQKFNEKSARDTLVSLLPKEVEILSTHVGKNRLSINFNSEYGNMSSSREVLVRAGIAKTYLQIPGIDNIEFLVNNEKLTDVRGQEIGLMTENTFAEFLGADKESYRYDTFILYFTDKTGSHLVKEERNLYYKRNLSKERVILEQLAKGPMVEGHYPVIPDNTEVLNVTNADSVCYVEFDHVFVDKKLDIPEEIAVYAVTNSILGNMKEHEVEKVQILINGNAEVNFGEDFSLYNFFQWNEELIEK